MNTDETRMWEERRLLLVLVLVLVLVLADAHWQRADWSHGQTQTATDRV